MFLSLPWRTSKPLQLKYSTLPKLVQVAAWCLRLSGESRVIYRICESTLTPAKIQQVITVLLKQSRDQSFAGNCWIIQSVKGLQKTSALFCPQPFLDKDSLIRVSRRLQKADLPQQSIHLTIFHLAKLIVQNLHITSRHACPSTMLANVSKSYYIIGVKCLIRSILKICVACQTTCLAQLHSKWDSYWTCILY